MNDWPGDIAALPHQPPVDRLRRRIANLLTACPCGHRTTPRSYVAWFWDAGAA